MTSQIVVIGSTIHNYITARWSSNEDWACNTLPAEIANRTWLHEFLMVAKTRVDRTLQCFAHTVERDIRHDWMLLSPSFCCFWRADQSFGPLNFSGRNFISSQLLQSQQKSPVVILLGCYPVKGIHFFEGSATCLYVIWRKSSCRITVLRTLRSWCAYFYTLFLGETLKLC